MSPFGWYHIKITSQLTNRHIIHRHIPGNNIKGIVIKVTYEMNSIFIF